MNFLWHASELTLTTQGETQSKIKITEHKKEKNTQISPNTHLTPELTRSGNRDGETTTHRSIYPT